MSNSAVVEQLCLAAADPKVGKNDLTIWSSSLPESELETFLNAWDSGTSRQFRWAMREEVSRFQVIKVLQAAEALPSNIYGLERLRLFGEPGDLDIRRNNGRFDWRYIGHGGLDHHFLVGFYEPDGDYWRSHSGSFTSRETRYFQWRRYGEERVTPDWWIEKMNKGEDAVYLKQRQYLDHGQVAFVRYLSMETEAKKQ